MLLPVRLSARSLLNTAALLALLLVSACSDPPPPPGPACWADVEALLLEMPVNDAGVPVGTCTNRTCHSNMQEDRVANLTFDGLTSEQLYQRLLQPSCEHPPYPLVTPGDPSRSWLLIKVDSPTMTVGTGIERQQAIVFNPDMPAARCTSISPATAMYGVLMPYGAATPNTRFSSVIRRWIAAGAPGPSDTCP